MRLQLENVCKRYPGADGLPDTPVLNGISLSVSDGDSIGIMGPSGSGKSTLLNIMGTLDRPSAGTVRLDDRDLAIMSERDLAGVRNREIGFVFQFHHLLPQCTVLENVLVPTLVGVPGRDPAAAEARARQLLERVGLSSRLSHTPGRLSGGECQRVAVVRALINKPKLLLADEPTGSLDQASAGILARLLADLNREEQTALVLVTHSATLAGLMSRQFTLAGGELQCGAPH